MRRGNQDRSRTRRLTFQWHRRVRRSAWLNFLRYLLKGWLVGWQSTRAGGKVGGP